MLTATRLGVALVLAVLSLWPAAAATRGVWTSHGPEGGTITALAIDPQTPTTLYAGTRVGGAFKSVDGGESWQAINNGLADVRIRRGGDPTSPISPIVDHDALGHLYVTAVAIDPRTPSTVYAATLTGNVFKSTNGGRSWRVLDVGKRIRFIRSLVIDPKTPTTIYVSGSPVDWNPGMPEPMSIYVGGGVLKSLDAGRHWSPVNAGLTQYSPLYGPKPDLGRPALAIDPVAPSTLYAATKAGVFKTTDGGANWRSVNSGLSGLEPTALVIDPQTTSTLYVAGRVTSLRSVRVFESIDEGRTWKAVSTRGLTTNDLQSLVIDPLRPTTIFAAGGSSAPGGHGPEGFMSGGIFKSTDGGRTWRSINHALTKGAVQALALHPRDSNTIYAGISSGGVFKSTDGGGGWRPINAGFRGLDLYPVALAIDPVAPTNVYAATDGGGILKSTDGGRNWRPTNRGLVNAGVRVLAVDPRTPSTLYAGTAKGGIFKSTDAGDSWHTANAGLGDVAPFDVTALVLDPRTPSTIYMSWRGSTYGTPSDVYKSVNGGETWVSTSFGLPDDRDVVGLAVAPETPQVIYASVSRMHGVIYRTSDGGRTWALASPSSNLGEVLAVDPQAADIVYASGVLRREGLGIFKSTDGGRSWRPINVGLTSFHVNAVAIDPRTPTTVYLGTMEWPNQRRGGVFKSIDGGKTWRPMNAGLTDLHIEALAIDPQTSSTIYAATRDGVFVMRR